MVGTFSKSLLHRDGTLNTGTACPYLDSSGEEMEMPDIGEAPTVDELAFLAESTSFGTFAVETLVDDALDSWVNNKDDVDDKHKEEVLLALKFARAFGIAIIVLYDEKDALDTPLQEPALEFEAFHPIIDKYGIQDWELDDLRRVKSFKIQLDRMQSKTVEVDASRCIVIPGPRKSSDWRGTPVLLPALQDIRDYWYWKRILAQRANTRAKMRYVLNKINGGNWSDTEKTSVDSAFEGVPHATVSGVDVKAVSGDLTDNEVVQTLNMLRESIAMSLKVSISGLRSSGSAQKPSGGDESNNTREIRTLRRIQRWAKPHLVKIFDKMGWEFDRLNPPWEVRMDFVDKAVLALSDAFVTQTDIDIKKLIKGRILSEYKDVKPAELNEEEPKDEFGGGFGGTTGAGAGRGPAGGGGATSNPGDRKRDRNQSNRNRQANRA